LIATSKNGLAPTTKTSAIFAAFDTIARIDRGGVGIDRGGGGGGSGCGGGGGGGGSGGCGSGDGGSSSCDGGGCGGGRGCLITQSTHNWASCIDNHGKGLISHTVPAIK